MELADRLKQAMRNCDNISQYALAKISEVPQPTINRILKGLSKEPKRSTLTLLAEKLGVSRDWLISEMGDQHSARPPILGEDAWNALSFKRRAIIEKITQTDLPDAVINALQSVIDATTEQTTTRVVKASKGKTVYFGEDRGGKEKKSG